MPLGSNDFEFIVGTGWDSGEVLHGTLDYGDDFDWEEGHLDFCECGNIKQKNAKRCYDCFNEGRIAKGQDDPYAIRERPKKDWNPVEYIQMIRAEIATAKAGE